MAADVTDLVRMLATAGQPELASIEERIHELSLEINEMIAPKKAEIAGLRTLQQAIRTKLTPETNGKQKLKAVCQSKPGDKSDLQIAIHDLLAEEGSMPVPAIAERLGKKPHFVGASVRGSRWFSVRNGEVHIAKTDDTARAN